MDSRPRMLPVLLAAILLIPAPAAAQKFGGVTAGATLSDLSDAYGAGSTDSRWGGTAGLVFGVRTYRSTTISLEPAWIQRGGGDLKADYLEVPLIWRRHAEQQRHDAVRLLHRDLGGLQAGLQW